ncbi:glutamate-5-semialdehyde dehydrogenase [Aneurinibacillus thermoaerophilus]|uniref:glutamate-5-semialdehyde dehydrogenase n=1 Tax=Aneurinibacillus TaxID=55079 RepID=UPI00070F43B7|nr:MULTISPECIES: glutamate-5-semialdehyde dehydrogenase [Aneurinibacillus]AMA71919.1 gamma-glutamyl-phosphate reductase [Aneurinibacillus sp. XH2]MED0675530.1 glutamate-5-semialdehyde dehydrogenase [Aneurinibacillus thermoaerophilus]MED0680297.1 glutamate-5-semialdehyde dehydrogenase [Aneurinibacillus thermoaerophilus]MED0757354.1 glutamate-5-semialdehyde dehydrogenase [Aneurinibacillus thermoaerophilus]MED0762109.1 glutamate-5-semialdehyde dehydrogenase [Aneurinibacillus thermoaerophilus]
MTLLDKAKLAKQAAAQMVTLTTEEKNQALLAMADALENNMARILAANEKDIASAKEAGVTGALIDRLMLTEIRVHDMSEGLRQVVELPDPIGEVMDSWERPNGLRITKVRVPLGVIGMIYEARPNVTVDATGLCLKSGNAVILRGSSSALHSNRILVTILREALLSTRVPQEAVQLLEEGTREEVNQMLKMNDYLDVLIPRGGAGLIRSVVENASVPVLETGAGNCHIYVDESAKPDMTHAIVINAKTQRPAVCNAAETLLVHEAWAKKHLPALLSALKEKNVELRGCERVRELAKNVEIIPATEEDWRTEYLDYTMAITVVESVDSAIEHINRYSTKHSEAIITESEASARKFLTRVDSAAVYHNASTRFTDGFEFGFGAEIGISTQKLHARGPMGLPALTSSKYVIYGTGQIR